MTQRSLLALLGLCSVALVACRPQLAPVTETGDTDDLDTTEHDTGPDTDDPDTEIDTDLGDGNQEWVRGDLTWDVDFDATAEAAGFTDCVYVRHYEASEDTARAWLCPSCDAIYLADVSFVSGRDSCYRQISATNPTPNELIGRAGSSWMRSRSYNRTLRDMGTGVLSGLAWTLSATGETAHTTGTVSFTVSGALERSRRDGDTTHGFTPPTVSACGWPRTGGAATSESGSLAVGNPLPPVALLDICDEPVDVTDLASGYLVLYSAAIDCVSCRQMAGSQLAFEAEVAGLGWDVTVVSVLVPALDSVAGDVSVAALSLWISSNGLQNRPVLRDRGYAFGVLGDIFPTTVVVAPDGTVIDIAQGYAGSWDYWGLQIDQDMHGED